MNVLPPLWPALACVLVASLLLRLGSPRRSGASAAILGALAWAPLVALAWAVSWPGGLTLARAALVTALVLAMLARDREDAAQSELALKLTWTLAAAFTLTWAGESLLTIAAGSAVPREQWPALALQLDPYALWMSALALTLLAGVVMLGAAPFHFWVADVLQGAPSWMSPLVVAAVQTAGAALLVHRLAGLASFGAGVALVRGVLSLAALLALVGGGATLAMQRRPERRVGTLASLQGGLVLAALAADPGHEPFASWGPVSLAAWSVHLALALAGAGALSRFLSVGAAEDEPAGALLRRHPWSGTMGLLALASLAGVPGTPGARLWLAVARELAGTRQVGLALALAFAWLVAFSVVAGEVRRAFGSPSTLTPPRRAVPAFARASLWVVVAGLMVLLLRH